jgi:hypothetical protein
MKYKLGRNSLLYYGKFFSRIAHQQDETGEGTGKVYIEDPHILKDEKVNAISAFIIDEGKEKKYVNHMLIDFKNGDRLIYSGKKDRKNKKNWIENYVRMAEGSVIVETLQRVGITGGKEYYKSYK